MAKSKNNTLTAKQQQAVQLIADGKSYREVATKVGSSSATISRWMNEHPPFFTALNAELAERHRASRARFRNMFNTALDTIEKKIQQGDLAAAMFVVRNIREEKPPKGPQSIRSWIDAQVRAAAWSEEVDAMLPGCGDIHRTPAVLDLEHELKAKWEG